MLKATEQEREHILEYMSAQAPEETVQLAQKVYSEQVHAVLHDIWDVHTDRGRWWVVTNPTFLYSQDQFPNMDLALTFHVGLCLRIPQSEEPSLTELPIEPFAACWRTLEEASEALRHAEEVEDFQAVGMRCRESLITLVQVAQDLIELSDASLGRNDRMFVHGAKLRQTPFSPAQPIKSGVGSSSLPPMVPGNLQIG